MNRICAQEINDLRSKSSDAERRNQLEESLLKEVKDSCRELRKKLVSKLHQTNETHLLILQHGKNQAEIAAEVSIATQYSRCTI